MRKHCNIANKTNKILADLYVSESKNMFVKKKISVYGWSNFVCTRTFFEKFIFFTIIKLL